MSGQPALVLPAAFSHYLVGSDCSISRLLIATSKAHSPTSPNSLQTKKTKKKGLAVFMNKERQEERNLQGSKLLLKPFLETRASHGSGCWPAAKFNDAPKSEKI